MVQQTFKATASWIVLISLIILSVSVNSFGNSDLLNEDEPFLYVDFDNCVSFFGGSNNDYSEFTASSTNNEDCSQLELINGFVYRDNTTYNPHSCTPGVVNDAMCISGIDSCSFEANSTQALRIDVMVMPGPNGFGSLKSLRFFEQAPENFTFVEGQTGPNNYPTLLGVRVLANGQEIYREIGIPTSRNWTFREIDFSNTLEFNVTVPTVFNIEILPYCLAGIESDVQAWDIDELFIVGGCNDVNGGIISNTGSNEICFEDTISGQRIFDVVMESGTNFNWFITDLSSNIIAISEIGTFDFDTLSNGNYNVYHIAYQNDFDGFEVGNSLSDLEGCFDLSNAINISNNQLVPGELNVLNNQSLEICLPDSLSNTISFELNGSVGEETHYVITDGSGVIIMARDIAVFDFGVLNDDSYQVIALTHNGILPQNLIGLNVNNLAGCIAISNSIQVNKRIVSGGQISVDGEVEINSCESSGFLIEPSLLGQFGQNQSWIIVQNTGRIAAISDTLPLDISIMGFEYIDIYHISYLDGIQGLSAGARLSEISGCFDLSNAIRVNMPDVNGGSILIDGSDNIEICTDNTENIFEVSISDSQGNNSNLLVTDTLGNILALPSDSILDLTNVNEGMCLVWNISFQDSISGLEVGLNVDNLSGCFDLSNPITISRIEVLGGVLSTQFDSDTITICTGDNISDSLFFNVIGNQGNLSRLLLVSETGIVLNRRNSFAIDIEGIQGGNCLIYHASFLSSDDIPARGSDIDSIAQCVDLSNPISLIRKSVDGGTIADTLGNTQIGVVVGDGLLENIEINLIDEVGDSSAWLITDSLGVILALPDGPPFNFENAGIGVCFIWHLSYSGSIQGLMVGENASDLTGCFDLSNSVEVTRSLLEGGEIELANGMTSISICTGNTEIDSIDVSLVNNEGPFSGWLITDESGQILELPNGPPFVFDSVPTGVCQIWHISFDSSLTGLEEGNNVSDLAGSFNLSNAITVDRFQVSAGAATVMDSLTSLLVCSGDGVDDILNLNSNGILGDSSLWVITNDQNVILDVTDEDEVNFEGVIGGTCFIYNVAFQNGISGIEIDSSLNDLSGCFDISNRITIERDFVDGGIISASSDTINIIVGDNQIDSIDVSVIDAVGLILTWVITNADGVILELPQQTPLVFEDAPTGTCIIYHLGLTDMTGLTVGENIADLTGCFDFSNSIVVNRMAVNGGNIMTTDSLTNVSLCIPEMMSSTVDVTLEGSEGDSTAWIITDDQGAILELPQQPPFDFGSAPSGVCQIWNISYIGTLSGLEIGQNVSSLMGSYSLSNSINVNRSAVDGGMISTTTGSDTINIIANDGIPDPFDVNLIDQVGDSTAWIITDDTGIVLALPSGPPFDLDSAGAGVCQVWHMSFNDTLIGLEIDSSVNNISGCFDLSNPITVIREALDGGDLETVDGLTDITVCLSDTINDIIDVVLTDTSAVNSAWLITDTSGLILELPMAPPFDFTTTPEGICQIWHLSYDNGLTGLEVNNNISDLMGAFDFSNSINVSRDSIEASSISLEDGSVSDTILVGDGIIDSIMVNATSVINDTMSWVVTDTLGNILALPDAPPFTFEQAGSGVCLIWQIQYSFGLSGLVMNENVSGLNGCFEFSNPITIVRNGIMGGTLTAEDGTTSFDFCDGNGIDQSLSVTLIDTLGPNHTWVITDTSGVILDLPLAPPFEFDGAGAGICLLWNITHEPSLTGLDVGANVDTLMGSHVFSNSIEIIRNEVNGGSIMTTDSLTQIMITVGDGVIDSIDVLFESFVGDTSVWVITDTSGVIVDLPDSPPFVFENAGGGVCQIWNLSHSFGLEGLTTGNNVSDLVGCFALSNPIEVIREGTVIEGGMLTSTNMAVSVDLCLTEGMSGEVEVNLTGSSGPNQSFVVTDTMGTILALPSLPIDLSGAGVGVCRIYNIAYANGLTGLEVDSSINNLMGAFDLSNSIEVSRNEVDGGQLTTESGLTEITIMVGEGINDTINVNLVDEIGAEFNWVVTDTLGNIVDLPVAPPFLFEQAGGGVCLLWNLSQSGNVTGLIEGVNISTVSGCFDLSNPIRINREGLNAGVVTDAFGMTTTSICLIAGVPFDLEVMLSDTFGITHRWVVTDPLGEILSLPLSAPIRFTGSSMEDNLVYNIAYDQMPTGIQVGNNLADIVGLFALSNPLTVQKSFVNGGSIEFLDGSLIDTIEVGEGVIDSVFVNLTGSFGDTTQWVVTDTLGNILALPIEQPFDFEDAGGGLCQIWSLSYTLGLQGLAEGNNVSQLAGCFDLSNPVEIFREGLTAGLIIFDDGTTSIEMCTGDDIADEVSVVVQGEQAVMSQVIAVTTTGQIQILDMTFPFNFENVAANIDTFLIYNIAYDSLPMNLSQGAFLSNLQGEFDLSNALIVDRNVQNGGLIEDQFGETSGNIIVGDGMLDTIFMDIRREFGDSLVWVITNEVDTIIDFQSGPEFTYPDNSSPGVERIYHLAYDPSDIMGLNLGVSVDSLIGCFALSNPYELTRKVLNGGFITSSTGDTLLNFCVGDGMADVVSLVRTGNLGSEFQYFITNSNGIILDILNSSSFDFETDGSGIRFIYNVSHDGSLTGFTEGSSIDNLGGCFLLSNAIRVDKQFVIPTAISFTNASSDTLDICAGDGVDDDIRWQVNVPNVSDYSYLITDKNNIIDTIIDIDIFDFDDSTLDTCLIYGISYSGTLTAEIGDTVGISDLANGCFRVSTNNLLINKEACNIAQGILIKKMFPNPVVDLLQVELHHEPQDQTTTYVYNSDGLIVQTIDMIEKDVPLDITQLDAGIYYLKVVSKGRSQLEKFVVLR